MNRKSILVIVGPTASGKSDLAVRLAKALAVSGVESEIVSADSRQVYRDLDIGTGKITPREMRGVPHHMLDVVSPKKVFSVAKYQKLTYKTIDGILALGKLPIVVGGTGQYVDSITKGLIVPEVPPNLALREKLSKLTDTRMFKLLKALDPARARQIDKHNPRRLVRAIEIAKALGKVPKLKSKPRYSPIIIGINPPAAVLKHRISRRLFARIREGMIAEVRRLHEQGVSWKRLYDLGLEYRYISLYLRGKLTKQEMLRDIETAINQYAKRQLTWFKRNKKITWLVSSTVERHERTGEVSLPRLKLELAS